jgi:two-component system cell cycle response regulator
MTTSAQAAQTRRGNAHRLLSYIATGGLALLVLFGAFCRDQRLGLTHALLTAAFVGVLATRILLHSREASDTWLELEIGCLILAATHALMQRAGGLSSPHYPVFYLLSALSGAVASRMQAGLLVLIAAAFEAPVYFLTEQHTDPKPYLLHALFMLCFGMLSTLITQGEILRLRLSAQRELSADRRRIAEEARLFRLAEQPPSTAARDEQALLRGSVVQVQSAVHWNLQLLKRQLALHSAVLLLRDGRDQLRSVAQVSDSADLSTGAVIPEGAVGAALSRGVIMHVDPHKAQKPPCYYRSTAMPPRALCALPIREHNEVIGVLCVDRIEERAFAPHELVSLQGSVEHLLHALANERVFMQLERSKREQDVLYEASQALGAAQTEAAVHDAALTALSSLVVHDVAAITHFDSQTGQHTVVRAHGTGAAHLTGRDFTDRASLVAMVVKNRHYLPYRGEFDARNQILFTRGEHLKCMQSALVFPLKERDAAIGTLVVAAERVDAFPQDVRPGLQLLANQVAVALGNVAAVARLEELATTDGLTGCYNKRHFNQELQERLHAATRFGKRVSLVIADIDHFKAVNDTYGHHTGDMVIRELGHILKRLRQGSDVVARFGGEEFCVLCDQTGAQGAWQLAERVRQELGQTTFETDHGPLQVTCSLGVATYPDHAPTHAKLFEAADRALYSAKHQGRNCSLIATRLGP